MGSRRSSDEIQAQVLDAAAASFTTHGVAATTIDDLVQATGIARATLYRHAGSKEELFLTVLLREIDSLVADLSRRVKRHDDVADIIVEATLRAIDLVRGNPLLVVLVSGAGAMADTVPDEAMDVFVEHLGRFVEPVFTDHAAALRPELTRADAVEVLLRTIVSHLTLGGRRRSRRDQRAFLQRTLVPVFVNDEHRSNSR